MNKAVLLFSVLIAMGVSIVNGAASWASPYRGRKPKVVVVQFDEKSLRRHARAPRAVSAAEARLYARSSSSAQDAQLENLAD